jgi:ribosomal protein S27E
MNDRCPNCDGTRIVDDAPTIGLSTCRECGTVFVTQSHHA